MVFASYIVAAIVLIWIIIMCRVSPNPARHKGKAAYWDGDNLYLLETGELIGKIGRAHDIIFFVDNFNEPILVKKTFHTRRHAARALILLMKVNVEFMLDPKKQSIERLNVLPNV